MNDNTKTIDNRPSHSRVETQTQVFARIERRYVNEIDRVADQMLMPRSWVVEQILKEWVERRQAEIHWCEDSWNGSIKEQLSHLGEDECIDPAWQQVE